VPEFPMFLGLSATTGMYATNPELSGCTNLVMSLEIGQEHGKIELHKYFI
jgi:hypothetical protein